MTCAAAYQDDRARGMSTSEIVAELAHTMAQRGALEAELLRLAERNRCLASAAGLDPFEAHAASDLELLCHRAKRRDCGAAITDGAAAAAASPLAHASLEVPSFMAVFHQLQEEGADQSQAAEPLAPSPAGQEPHAAGVGGGSSASSSAPANSRVDFDARFASLMHQHAVSSGGSGRVAPSAALERCPQPEEQGSAAPSCDGSFAPWGAGLIFLADM